MGFNEALLLVEAVICAGLVIAVWTLDRERLMGVIAIALILITTAGGKVIEVFGHETNTGNLFYASIFLATYFLIERYGRRAGMRAVWWGVAAVVSFLALAELSVAFVGSGQTGSFDAALFSIFDRAPRIALASLVAYVASQSLNVYLYAYLKRRLDGGRLWLRANIANALAQVLDSAVFFSIAFIGVVPPPHVFDIIVTGYVIKTCFIAVAAPLLYFNTVEEEEGDTASVTIRYDRISG
jgi:hypothetical protein